MCGIVGYYTTKHTPTRRDSFISLVEQSKLRGLHAFGVVGYEDGNYKLLRSHDLDTIEDYIQANEFEDAIAHTRYSTSGDWHVLDNNQPLDIDGYTLAFNGVISMKTKAQMEQEYNCKLTTDNDGELFINHLKAGGDPVDFVMNMAGSFAGIWYDPDGNMYALRNERRPLWWFPYDADTIFIVSTKDIIKRAFTDPSVADLAVECSPGVLYSVDDLWRYNNENFK